MKAMSRALECEAKACASNHLHDLRIMGSWILNNKVRHSILLIRNHRFWGLVQPSLNSTGNILPLPRKKPSLIQNRLVWTLAQFIECWMQILHQVKNSFLPFSLFHLHFAKLRLLKKFQIPLTWTLPLQELVFLLKCPFTLRLAPI